MGEFLAGNYPNRLDAWLAAPLVHTLPLPERYDLLVLGILVLNAWAAYFALTALTRVRPLAWVGGLFFGLSIYGAMEIEGGRPVTALIAPFALATGTWLRALDRPGRTGDLWAALSGGTLALAGFSYLPSLAILQPLLLGSAAARLAWPGEASRRRVIARVAGGALLGVLLIGPYLHEVLVVRPQPIPEGHRPTAAEAAIHHGPSVWIDLAAKALGEGPVLPTVQTGPRPPGAEAPYWFPTQTEAYAWDYLWNVDPGASERLGFVAPTVLVGAAALALVGRRRGLAWLALAALYWLVTLGPNLASKATVDGVTLYLVDGYRIGLPTAWVLRALPAFETYLRPYRADPMFLLSLGACLTVGLDALAGRSPPAGAGAGQRIRLPLALLLAAVIGARGFVETRALPSFTPWTQTWREPAFVTRLATEPGDFAIAELPAGVGHMLGGFAAIHGKRRSEPIHDLLYTDRRRPPPPGCYQLTFLRALWYLGVDGPDAERAISAGLSPEGVAKAAENGFRYVVMYPQLYSLGAPRGDNRPVSAIRARLDAALGPPIQEDGDTVVWMLPAPAASSPGATPGTAGG